MYQGMWREGRKEVKKEGLFGPETDPTIPPSKKKTWRCQRRWNAWRSPAPRPTSPFLFEWPRQPHQWWSSQRSNNLENNCWQSLPCKWPTAPWKTGFDKGPCASQCLECSKYCYHMYPLRFHATFSLGGSMKDIRVGLINIVLFLTDPFIISMPLNRK